MNGTSTVATDDRRLFVLSAKTENSLTSYMSTLDEYLAEEAPEDNELIKDLSHALGQRRTHHPHRTFAVAASVASLQEKLSTAKLSTKGQIIAFAFTGQSAQYVLLFAILV
jgi:acyl transferase domain-containing protein